MKRHLFSAAALVLVASFAHAESGAAAPAAPASASKASAAASGIATQYIDAGVRPQDDFFEHLNGKWLKSVEIPADKSTWGAFHQLRDDTLPQLRACGNRLVGDGHRGPNALWNERLQHGWEANV